MLKKFIRPTVILGISLILALVSAAVTYTTKIAGLEVTTRAALSIQTTPSVQSDEAVSEVGSTDGIVTMGGVIVAIVILPILLKYNSWKKVD